MRGENIPTDPSEREGLLSKEVHGRVVFSCFFSDFCSELSAGADISLGFARFSIHDSSSEGLFFFFVLTLF